MKINQNMRKEGYVPQGDGSLELSQDKVQETMLTPQSQSGYQLPDDSQIKPSEIEDDYEGISVDTPEVDFKAKGKGPSMEGFQINLMKQEQL